MMLELFEKLILLFEDTTVFMFCSYFGIGILIVQFLLGLIGLENGEDFTDGDMSEARQFKYLSLQTIGGFLMMFGLTGITCQKEYKFHNWLSFFLSLLVGLCSVLIINLIFRLAKKLQSSGSVCNLDDVIGQEAFVYQRIPKNGVGKITISFQHLTCEIDAVTSSQEELPSFTRVQIIKKRDDSTAVVIPI